MMTRRRAMRLREKGYMTITDLSDYLGVSVKTLRAWRLSGKLPAPAKQYDGASLWSPRQVTEVLNVVSRKT